MSISKQQRVEVYHQLCILLQERDTSNFTVRLQQLMSLLGVNYKDFFNYINTQYVGKVKE